jgi:transcriptional regulator with XRE-family HTH domain
MFRVKGQLVDLAEALPAARGEAGLSQFRLAVLLGVGLRTVYSWEHGVTPQISRRPLIQAFLDDPVGFSRRRLAPVPDGGEVAA